jgi:hypothetical protein
MEPAPKSLLDLVKDIVDIKGRVERNPYGMVGGALGAGFVLGGGLFTRFTGQVVNTALRIGVMAALPRLEKEFASCVGRTAEVASPSSEKGGSS